MRDEIANLLNELRFLVEEANRRLDRMAELIENAPKLTLFPEQDFFKAEAKDAPRNKEARNG